MSRKTQVVCLCLAACIFAAPQLARAADEADDYEDPSQFRASIIVHKKVEGSTKDLPYPIKVEGRNVTVSITLTNIGNGPASNVVVTDEIPSNAQLLDGSLTATFPKIAQDSAVTHKYTIVFTSGGSMDVTFLPSATVKYSAEEDSEQVGSSTKAGVYVLTAVQQITRFALVAGSYASLGLCRTPADWRNMAIILGIVGGFLAVNWTMKTFRSSTSSSSRKKALQELEKDE